MADKVVYFPAVALGGIAMVGEQIVGRGEPHIHMEHDTARIIVPQVAAVTTSAISSGMSYSTISTLR